MTDQPAGSPQIPTHPYDDAALRRARELLDAIPETIGPFRILERIGGGGMGEVYRAEQRIPIRREVALKVIKLGMDTRAVIARFEAERQALALMDHPHIAKIFDAGSDETGRPYFVMEYVKGKPITEYADLNRLTISERLELFEQVCQAVQHAHHKGIIHRDLKPSNILVSTQDGKPHAKVIDFGIAKATSQQLTDKTLFTRHDQFIGTPQYMSPEQAEGNLDIDTRTDIYSLGVLLYELLTGSPPFSATELKLAAFDQLKKMIMEVDPPAPSMRLSQSGQTLPSLAACRKIEPRRLGSTVRGELDWIVMKALEKDRQRRYQTPISLASDIAAHKNREPIQAAPPSFVYRMRKFCSRHRGKVLAALGLCLMLLTGIGGTTWALIRVSEAEQKATAQYHEAERQRGMASELAHQESEQRQRADAIAAEERQTREKSEQRLVQLQQINGILSDIFRDLNPYDYERGDADPDKSLREILGNRLVDAAAKLDGDAIGDLDTVARMQLSLAESLKSLGYFDQAIDLCLKAKSTLSSLHGANSFAVLGISQRLAYLYSELNRPQEALSEMQEVVRQYSATTEMDAPRLLFFTHNLAEMYRRKGDFAQAIPLFTDVLERQTRVLGPRDDETLKAKFALATTLADDRQYEAGIRLMREAIQSAREDHGLSHEVCNWTTKLANTYLISGQSDLAFDTCEKLLEEEKRTLGPRHSDTINTLVGLGYICWKGKVNHAKAISVFSDLADVRREKFGTDHPKTLDALFSLAICNWDAGYKDVARQQATQLIDLATARYGSDHPVTLKNMTRLTGVMTSKNSEKIPYLEKLVAAHRKSREPDVKLMSDSMEILAAAYLEAGDRVSAMNLLEESGRLQKSTSLTGHSAGIQSKLTFAQEFAQTGRCDQALEFAESALKSQQAAQGDSNPRTSKVMARVADIRMQCGRMKEAWELRHAIPVATHEEMLLLLELATLEAWYGQTSEYKTTCEKALSLAQDSDLPRRAVLCAQICCCQPGLPPEQLEQVLILIRNAVKAAPDDPLIPFFYLALGMTEYRAGNNEDGYLALEKAASEKNGKPALATAAALYQVMCLQRMGKADEASALLEATSREMKPQLSRRQFPFIDGANRDDVIAWLAFDEAMNLLKPSTSSTPPAVTEEKMPENKSD